MNERGDQPSLADPHNRPGRDIVIYDDQCRFCTAQVQRLARWDRGERLAFLSLHDRRVAKLCPGLTHEQLMQQMYLVTPSGKRFGGAAAARYLSRHMVRLWPLVPLLHLPGSLPIWQWLYHLVARRRYALGRLDACDSNSCDVHLK